MILNKTKIPKLIIITRSKNFVGEFDIINSLFNEGLECLHLRKHDYDIHKLEHWLKDIDKNFHNKIVIHSHHKLKDKFQLKGIHFTNHHLKQVSESEISLAIQAARIENLTISSSLHSIVEINSLKTDFDYVFLSPIYESISKLEHKSKFNIPDLSKCLQNESRKTGVIALGGIDEGNANETIMAGFEGVALHGTLWGSETKSIIEKFARIKNSIL